MEGSQRKARSGARGLSIPKVRDIGQTCEPEGLVPAGYFLEQATDMRRRAGRHGK